MKIELSKREIEAILEITTVWEDFLCANHQEGCCDKEHKKEITNINNLKEKLRSSLSQGNNNIP